MYFQEQAFLRIIHRLGILELLSTMIVPCVILRDKWTTVYKWTLIVHYFVILWSGEKELQCSLLLRCHTIDSNHTGWCSSLCKILLNCIFGFSIHLNDNIWIRELDKIIFKLSHAKITYFCNKTNIKNPITFPSETGRQEILMMPKR